MPLFEPDAARSIPIMGATANTTVIIPAGYGLSQIIVENTTANAVTGGIKVGTTSGGVDVVIALTVGANALTFVSDAALLKRFFSRTAEQTLFVQAVTSWNSASVNFFVVITKLVA